MVCCARAPDGLQKTTNNAQTGLIYRQPYGQTTNHHPRPLTHDHAWHGFKEPNHFPTVVAASAWPSGLLSKKLRSRNRWVRIAAPETRRSPHSRKRWRRSFAAEPVPVPEPFAGIASTYLLQQTTQPTNRRCMVANPIGLFFPPN